MGVTIVTLRSGAGKKARVDLYPLWGRFDSLLGT
jgi:hypothetical protein